MGRPVWVVRSHEPEALTRTRTAGAGGVLIGGGQAVNSPLLRFECRLWV